MSQSANTIPRLGLSVLVSMIPVAVALADSAPVPRTYGTSSEIILQLPAVGFVPWTTRASSSFGYITGGLFDSPVHLPNGAVITSFVLYYWHGSGAAKTVTATLWEDSGGNGVAAESERKWGPLSSNGDLANVVGFTLDPPLTVNNSNQYFVEVDVSDLLCFFKAVDIRYHLQVSPAPATATFGDVPPTHPFFRVIEALAASRITSGCGSGNFCPDKTVTRGELAKFLAVALGLHWPE